MKKAYEENPWYSVHTLTLKIAVNSSFSKFYLNNDTSFIIQGHLELKRKRMIKETVEFTFGSWIIPGIR